MSFSWKQKRHTRVKSADMTEYEKILLAVGNDPSLITTSSRYPNEYTTQVDEYQTGDMRLANGLILLNFPEVTFSMAFSTENYRFLFS